MYIILQCGKSFIRTERLDWRKSIGGWNSASRCPSWGQKACTVLPPVCIPVLVCHLAAFFQSGCSWYWNVLVQDTLCWLHSRWSHISSSFEAYNAWNRFPLTLWLDMVRTFYWFAVMSVHQKIRYPWWESCANCFWSSCCVVWRKNEEHNVRLWYVALLAKPLVSHFHFFHR